VNVVDRVFIAQAILDALGNGTYLEIGVNTGSSFIPIKAKRKWGVDPGYVLTGRRLAKYAVFSFLGLKDERLFRITSDEFFMTKGKALATGGVDVCLVDGLHTYEQSLRDVLNTLPYLTPKGVILMHDCNPSTKLRALPVADIDELIRQGIPGWDGAWSGDVWKSLVHLRSLRDDVAAFALDCDTGIGVVTKGRPGSRLPYSEAEILKMDYSVLVEHRSDLLGLQSQEYFQEFLRRHIE
jgi:hypothetical protein